MSGEWGLGIDFGTTSTIGAAIAGDDAKVIEVDGERRVPSLVLLGDDGSLIAGMTAANQAAMSPERVERTPKRSLGKPHLVLGDELISVTHAVGVVLGLVLEEGRRLRGGVPPQRVVLTHPARWGSERKNALAASALAAGIVEAELVEEPVAAAAHYATDKVSTGQCVAIYDLGGGTFDTAVLSRTEDGFEVVGAPGGHEEIGGEDFDFRLYRLIGDRLGGEDPEKWEKIRFSTERQWQRAGAELLNQVRRAKESLSAYPTAQFYAASFDKDVHVTRKEFEALIRDDIERTVDELDDTIARSGVASAELAGIYLVGGSSRIPLVASVLQDRFGADAVETWDDPQSVVALGAARLARPGSGVARRAAAPAAPVAAVVAAAAPSDARATRVGAATPAPFPASAPVAQPVPPSAPAAAYSPPTAPPFTSQPSYTPPSTSGSGGPNKGLLIGGGIAAAVVLLILGFVVLGGGGGDDGDGGEEAGAASETVTTPPESGADVPADTELVGVTDDTGAFEAQIPAEWTDVRTTEEVFDDGTSSPRLQASTDIDTFVQDYSVPGVDIIGVFAANVVLSDDEVLDVLAGDQNCEAAERQDYDDGFASGRLEVLSDCAGTGTVVINVSALDPSGNRIQFTGQAVDSDDVDLVFSVFESLGVGL